MNEMAISNQPMDEMSRLAVAARDALTDQIVERVAITGGHALALLDRLNDESTSAAVHGLIDRLTEMHKVGALDTVCDVVMLLHAGRSAMTDSIVERVAFFIETIVNSLVNEEVGALVHEARNALEEAAADTAKTPAHGGIVSMLSTLAKPETQASLQFLVNFAGKLQKRANSDRTR